MDVTSYSTTNATEVLHIRVSFLDLHTMICARLKFMVSVKLRDKVLSNFGFFICASSFKTLSIQILHTYLSLNVKNNLKIKKKFWKL